MGGRVWGQSDRRSSREDRQLFPFAGLVERPGLPPQAAADTVSYKVFVSGRNGVGKTALVAKLAGLEVPALHHETTGDDCGAGDP